MDRYLLKAYVAGKDELSETALATLRQICEEQLSGQYELVVIDILERPQLAEDERILATPTVVKKLPPPLRTVVGDLSDCERVLIGLDLQAEQLCAALQEEVS